MKSASTALKALLNSGNDFVMADLWTLTLNGGAVIRWSGADIAIKYGGQTYALGPMITRGPISEKIGLEVATLDMTIDAGPTDLINGTAAIPFIVSRGLDGAVVRLDRAFAPDWATMQAGATGTILRFAGKVTSIGEIAGTSADIVVSSWAVLLNVQMPANMYQAACLHTVYDAGCALTAAAFAVSGTITGSPTTLGFSTGLSGLVSNDYALGRVVFTTGANAGIARAIKSNTTSAFSLIQPLPAPPAPGDAFTVYPGCDLTQARCSGRFNNLGHFKGTPYVPPAVTAI